MSGDLSSYAVSLLGSYYILTKLNMVEYATVNIVIGLPDLFLMLTNWGINTACIQFISEKKYDFTQIFYSGFIIKISTSLVGTGIIYLFSDHISVHFLKRADIGIFLRMSSVLLILLTLYNFFRAICIGYEDYTNPSKISLVKVITKYLISIILIYKGYRITGVIYGTIISFIISDFVYYFVIVKKRNNDVVKIYDTFILIYRLLIFGYPLFIGSLISIFNRRIKNVLLPYYGNDDEISNLSASNLFYAVVNTITGSFTTTYLTALSKYDHTVSNIEDLFNECDVFMRYTSIFISPIIIYSIFYSNTLLSYIFQDKFAMSSKYNIYLMMPLIFVLFGNKISYSLFISQKDTQVAMKIMSFSSFILLIVSVFCLELFGIVGYLYSIIISIFIETIIQNIYMYKKYEYKIKIFLSLQILLTSVSSGLVSYYLPITSNISLIIMLIKTLIFFSTYVILLLIQSIITKSDLLVIKQIFIK